MLEKEIVPESLHIVLCCLIIKDILFYYLLSILLYESIVSLYSPIFFNIFRNVVIRSELSHSAYLVVIVFGEKSQYVHE